MIQRYRLIAESRYSTDNPLYINEQRHKKGKYVLYSDLKDVISGVEVLVELNASNSAILDFLSKCKEQGK